MSTGLELSDWLIKGFYATTDFWRQQAFGKLLSGKSLWHRYGELRRLSHDCAFCQLFGRLTNSKAPCEGCPIGQRPFRTCMEVNSFYDNWMNGPIVVVRRYGAIRLYLIIRKWMKANLPDYFKRSRVVK